MPGSGWGLGLSFNLGFGLGLGLGLGFGLGFGLGLEAVGHAGDVGKGAGGAKRVDLGAPLARGAGRAQEAVRLHLPARAVTKGTRRAACGYDGRLGAVAAQLTLLAVRLTLRVLVLSCIARETVGQAGQVTLAAARALLGKGAATGAPFRLGARRAVVLPCPPYHAL